MGMNTIKGNNLTELGRGWEFESLTGNKIKTHTSMNLIVVTQTSGKSAYVNPSKIVTITEEKDKVTVIETSNGYLFKVTESPAKIAELIKDLKWWVYQ